MATMRSESQKTLKGIFLGELMLEDDKLAKQNPPTIVNGRQLAWMMRRKFDVDITQTNVVTECEVHALRLQE